MGIRDLLFIGLVAGASATLASSLYPRAIQGPRTSRAAALSEDVGHQEPAHKVDEAFRARWTSEGITPAPKAPVPTIVRRISLALTGSIPSLEEWRRLEKLGEGDQADRWVDGLLCDRRYADALAERLARAFVGTEGGPFIVYRRRRFVSWLSDQVLANRPYDAIVRDLIETDGLWTDRPATNFLTVTYDPDKKQVDPERLAGRVSRAFLGIRLDCAQCHDHPFERWKQADFQGLAAFFGQAQSGFTGIHEEPGEFTPTDRKTNKPVTIAPRVPFAPELLPETGNRRTRLGHWLTDPKNPALARATVNRVWALMFGKPLVEPIDDLGTADERPVALDLLADDFVNHGYDLRRLIRAIASTEVFRLDSALPEGVEATEAMGHAWAVFPLTRLRPDQVVGSLLQSASLTTIDAESPIVVRILRSLGHNQFVERYGDLGEDEFDGRAGTIPQRLLMLNGELVQERTKGGVFNGVTRIGYFAPSDAEAVRLVYLTTLGRAPTAEEATHFGKTLDGLTGSPREERLSDMFWSLVNATEFSWNH